MSDDAWVTLQAEARRAFLGTDRFPLRAYSEFMPSPYVGLKPYLPDLDSHSVTFSSSPNALDIDEYEQTNDLQPGLDRIADRIIGELSKLVHGQPHGLSRTLLEGNPAWPAELQQAAQAGRLADEPLVLALPLALSRTQDDKGNNRWTLFGTSHEGAAAPIWRSFDAAALERLVRFADVQGPWRIIADDLPDALRELRWSRGLDGLAAVVTFVPFARLPPEVRAAYLDRKLRIVPTPASLVWFEHPGYRALGAQLPLATQIPLLHIFPRVERSCAI